MLEIHVILHRALRDACRQGLVVRNVADDAEPPKRRRPRTDVRAWNAAQLQAFLRTAKTDRLFPAYWLAANTGMRRSELLGLRWEDVDLASGNPSINKLDARAGVPRRRLHDLRHTHATLLLKAGVPIKVVSERLGHATPGFTMATYQHVLPGMQAEAAHTFAGVIASTELVSTEFDPVDDPVEVDERDEALARNVS